MLITCLCFLSVLAEKNDVNKQKIFSLVDKGSIVLNDKNGKNLVSYNTDELLVPASIIKILTSYIAIDILGKDYSFKTEFYTDGDGNLAIKGWGDPFLISEEIEIITKTLKEKELTNIKQIYLDHSVFAPVITIPGVSKTSNPYDALNGALVVNFNTINIEKDAKGKIHSGEPETPLTPLAIKKGEMIKAGTKQRVNLTKNKEDCLQYVGELFSVFFKSAGVTIENEGIAQITVQPSWKLFYTHNNTRKITEVIKGLLKYSNNFIANQIFLTIGAEKKGYPATLEKAKDVFEDYIKTKLNLTTNELVMYEGSGISRSNKITGNVMAGIMEEFRAYADLLSPNKDGIPVKSGTLTGVSNYAGYIKTKNGLRPFVIILNQKSNNRDTILSLLAEYFK
jgi:D-alanyl-D-alanine carboxypeptidase/D-alanyl-D-alanine-endopeptidase (penicillin-binding protein 4)